MPAPPLRSPTPTDANFRSAGAATLQAMLQASRSDTLATFACYENSAGGLAVPYGAELNPPLWELGHVGWFQAHWLARNPERLHGERAEPAQVLAGVGGLQDGLYDSSLVPHATRWQLPLLDARATRAALAATLDESLALLEKNASPTAQYFHRLCLAHEDMHHEAAVYMAQALGVPLHNARYQPRALPPPAPALQLPAALCVLGRQADNSFAFDNECGQQTHTLPACSIDNQVLRWRDYLPFVEDGGYANRRWWPGRAAAWRAAPGHTAPRYLQRAGAQWQRWRDGQWQALDLDEPACHLTAYEADAWCAWAGRRLPAEAEWQRAAQAEPERYRWGAVWEWTASSFGPYDGFVAHPYRDYSAPWFGSRRVLRGASVATQPRLRDVHYRNFYTPDRNDIFAGFRSCGA